MDEVQVFDGDGDPGPARTLQQLEERIRPFLEDYRGFNVSSAAITRGSENIRYAALTAKIREITKWSQNSSFRTEFIRDYHFWTGVPFKDLHNINDRELLGIIAGILVSNLNKKPS